MSYKSVYADHIVKTHYYYLLCYIVTNTHPASKLGLLHSLHTVHYIYYKMSLCFSSYCQLHYNKLNCIF